MADPIVVAIPTRDRPEMLAAAIASVRAQTDSDWIAVVADDGDGDPAGESLPAEVRGDARIEVVRVAGRSPGSARNAAIRRGLERLGDPEGVLVALLDDDDRWDPDHLAAMRAALQADPAATFAHGVARTRSDAGEAPYHARERLPLPRDLFPRLLERDVVATSTVLLRADAWRAAGGFREDLSHGEDWAHFLALSRAGPAAFVPRATVTYLSHPDNTSRDHAKKIAAQSEALVPFWRRRHLLSPADRTALRRTISRRHARLIRALLLETNTPRSAIRRRAGSLFRDVPSARTALAWLSAALPLPRPRGI